MDCIWVNLKNVGPPFFQIYISLNQFQLLCGRDLANERLLLCQFDIWSS